MCVCVARVRFEMSVHIFVSALGSLEMGRYKLLIIIIIYYYYRG